MQAKFVSDNALANGWYRFMDVNSNQFLQTNCLLEVGRCGTISPGWMQGKTPTGTKFLIHRLPITNKL